MDASYIKPFVTSIQNVFSTMLQLNVTVQTPYLKTANTSGYDVSGIIGLSGEVTGSVVLSFPRQTAERVVALLAGSAMEFGTPDFCDAIGELVNMISGNAKALFKTKKASISCPSVVLGEHHMVARQSDQPTIIIPCSTDCGEVLIEITIRESQPAANANATASASATA